MKKLLALLNTPARAVIAVGLIILLGEFLIMMLIEDAITHFVTHELWHLIDPILLIAIVSPAFYLLIFRPLRKQQAELEDARKKIAHALQEWIAALDVIDDPVFLHDKEFRILRCNRAYQQCAGIPFHELIGKPYYEVFPKTGAPLPYCLQATEKAEAKSTEEEVVVGGAIYRSRVFSVKDEQGAYLYSVHTLVNITEHKLAESKLAEQLEELRSWNDVTLGREMRVLELKHEVDELLGQAGQPPRYPSAESDDQQEK